MINRSVKGKVLLILQIFQHGFYFSSPFNVQVLPHFEANKVVVDGPGVRNGVSASLETSFRIDTRDAGVEQTEISIKVRKP